MIHRDLKPPNVFLLSDQQIKLGDFGLCKILANSDGSKIMDDGLGTLYYRPPESFKRQEAGFESDVWALGCTIHELVTLKKTFKGPENTILDVKRRVFSCFPCRLPQRYNRELRYVVAQMTKKVSSERPTA